MTQYLLILMFFVTSPYNLSPAEKKAGHKDESKHIWTFQHAMSVEFPTRLQCRLAGANMIDEILPVATMNVRGWCVCIGSDDNACPKIKVSANKNAPAVSRLLNELNALKSLTAPPADSNRTVTFEPIDAPLSQ